MDKLKTINLKGKDYVEVNERLKYFRSNYDGYSLITEVVEVNEKFCVLKANVINPDGHIIATGLAREVNGQGNVNRTSFLENCETSAWGRALANFGIGIDASVASYNEVNEAINNDFLIQTMFQDFTQDIINSKSYDDLKKVFEKASGFKDSHKKEYSELLNMLKHRKSELSEVTDESKDS